MWKNKNQEKTEHRKGRIRHRAKARLLLAALLCGLGLLGGCNRNPGETAGESPTAQTAAEQPTSGEPLRIGLILSSRDDPENETIQAAFRTLADDLGAELSVQTPDVSATEAAEARELAYHTFVLCDVNPIEYQMLAVNELVAENVDVIVIHANHEEALESVLSAARRVGVRVIAFEDAVTDASCDAYAETSEEAVAVIKSE